MNEIEPTNEGAALPAVPSTDWLDALAESWDRRVLLLTPSAPNDIYIQGRLDELKRHLEELRAKMASASNDTR